jgi:hypothetical protein
VLWNVASLKPDILLQGTDHKLATLYLQHEMNALFLSLGKSARDLKLKYNTTPKINFEINSGRLFISPKNLGISYLKWVIPLHSYK